MPETIYDVAIIGSGPAGYTAAIRAGQLGLKTCLIEKEPKLGGTCLHVGCIPTKALLFSAEVYDHIKDAREYGITVPDGSKVDWPAVQDRKNKIVAKHAKGLEFLMKKNKVAVVVGLGRLTGPAQNGVHTVEVEHNGAKQNVQARNLLLATGSVARMLPGLKPDDRILSNVEILNLRDIPKSIVIIGSGAVGVEFASVYKSFGSADVTVLEMLPRIVPVEDEEVSKELARVYRKRGINTHVNAKVEKVERTKNGVSVSFTVDGKPQTLEAEKCLVAVGRAPLTEKLNLEKVPGIKVERGFIHVDEYMRTGVPGIYAVGDICAGYPQLAHAGGREGIIAVTQIAGKPVKPVKKHLIPGATYCRPEIGSVGLTEAKAKEMGYDVKVGKFPFTANSRASIVGQHEGFIKIVSEAKYGEVLGVHIIGPQATELIMEAVAALELEARVEDLMAAIHAHPTLSEAMGDAVASVYGMAINA